MSTRCPICEQHRVPAFSATLLRKYPAEYLHCQNCGLLQIAGPTWLDEAYSSAISAIDTGLVQRNLQVASRLRGLYGSWFGGAGKYVDVAGGSGLLVRLLRDQGIDAYWTDPYADNQFARGFEAQDAVAYVGASAIEVLEHVGDPLAFLDDTFEQTQARALVFTTELYEGAPPPTDWWYYQFETGQHITFMERRTLEKMASALNAKLLSRGAFHALIREKLPAAPFYAAATRFARLQAQWHRPRQRSLTDSDSQLLKGRTETDKTHAPQP